MANGIPTGAELEVPDLPGRWSVWSNAADVPGSVFVVPANDQARATGIKYAVVRVKFPPSKPAPEVSLLRTDPATPISTGAMK